jgi:hypothetical protein
MSDTRMVASSTPRTRKQEGAFTASARGRRGAGLKHKAIELPLENTFTSKQMMKRMHASGTNGLAYLAGEAGGQTFATRMTDVKINVVSRRKGSAHTSIRACGAAAEDRSSTASSSRA